MKKLFLAVTLALSVLFNPLAAHAVDGSSTDKPLKIGVVDLQSVLRETKAGRSIQEQLEKLRKNFQEEFSKQEEKLRGQDQELTKLRSTLSAEEFANRRREFEKNVAAAQRSAQEKRKQLEQAIGSATQELEKKIFEVVGKIAEDRALTLVLSRSQVFLAQRSIDITKETIQNLDAQITSVPVKLTAAKAEAKKPAATETKK